LFAKTKIKGKAWFTCFLKRNNERKPFTARRRIRIDSVTLTLYRPAMPFGNIIFFEDLFSSVLSRFKTYQPSGNLKFYNLGILKSLKLRILVEKKILPISLKLNFTPNTLGCKGIT